MHHNTSKHTSKKFVPHKGQVVTKKAPIPVLTGAGKIDRTFTVVSWNVNGIRSALNKNLIRDLIILSKPDIICINDTKISQDKYQKEQIQIEGFHGYWNFCKSSAGYSGVAVFTKFIPYRVEEDLLEPEHSQEGRVLTLEFQLFYLIVVYIPFAGLKLERLEYKTTQFEPAFFRHCERVKDKGKGVIIAGDLNTAVDFKDTHFTAHTIKSPGFTKIERKNLKIFLELGWVDTFRHLNPNSEKYTWWHLKRNGKELRIGKRFDYFLVSDSFKEVVLESQVLEELMATDHSPIVLKVDLSLSLIKQKCKNFFWLKSEGGEGNVKKKDQQKECGQQKSEVKK